LLISDTQQHQPNALVEVRDQDPVEPAEGDDQSVPEKQGQIRRQEREGRNPCRRHQIPEEEVQTITRKRKISLEKLLLI